MFTKLLLPFFSIASVGGAAVGFAKFQTKSDFAGGGNKKFK